MDVEREPLDGLAPRRAEVPQPTRAPERDVWLLERSVELDRGLALELQTRNLSASPMPSRESVWSGGVGPPKPDGASALIARVRQISRLAQRCQRPNQH